MKILSQFKRLFHAEPQTKLSTPQLQNKVDAARARVHGAQEDLANVEASEPPWQHQPSAELRSAQKELKSAKRELRALSKQLKRADAQEAKASAANPRDAFETGQAAPRKSAAPALSAAPSPPSPPLPPTAGARARSALPIIQEES